MSDLVRERRIARGTGTEVELVDAGHPDCRDFDPAEGGRWVTVCVDHGGIAQHGTWRNARQWLGHPEEWCPTCQDDSPEEGAVIDSRGGFSQEERDRAAETRRRKAEERRKERDDEKAAEQTKCDLEDQWTAWTVSQPIVDRVYTDAQREAHDVAHATMVEASAEARKARQGHRQAEERLADLPETKSRRERRNLARLEAEATSLDERVVEQEDRARIAREEADRIARRAFLSGCLQAGWTLNLDAGSGVLSIEKGDRRVRVPDDYLPPEDLPALLISPRREAA